MKSDEIAFLPITGFFVRSWVGLINAAKYAISLTNANFGNNAMSQVANAILLKFSSPLLLRGSG